MTISEETSKPQHKQWLNFIILGSIILVGLLVRMAHQNLLSGGSDFPINDGGLFYQMVQELDGAGLKLPETTAYNHLDIPFAYPPFGLYLTLFFWKISGMPLLDVFIYLPLILSTLTIPAFYIFADGFLKDRPKALIATGVFSFMPNIQFLVFGGSVTRATALIFTLLTLAALQKVYEKPSNRSILLTALFASLTVLSHPGFAFYIFVSALFFFLLFGKSRQALKHSVMIGLLVIIMTSFWWAQLLSMHGLDLFTAAFGSNPSNIFVAFLYFAFNSVQSSGSITIFSALLLMAAVTSSLKDRWFLILWILVSFGLNARTAIMANAIPVALLIAEFLGDDIFTKWWSSYRANFTGQSGTKTVRASTLFILKIFMVVVFLLSTTYVVIGDSFPEDGWPYTEGVSAKDRQAIEWIKNNTSETSNFLILSDITLCGNDSLVEWFPVLANRFSATTVQGREWLPNQAFKRTFEACDAVRECYDEELSCITQWLDDNAITIDYLYFSDLDRRLSHSIEYTEALPIVYQQGDIVIYDFPTTSNTTEVD